MRAFSFDADTRTLVLECFPSSLTAECCHRAVITNCRCVFEGQVVSESIDQRRLLREPLDFLLSTETAGESAVFETASGRITVFGGMASVDTYAVNSTDMPINAASLAELDDWRSAA